MNHSINPFVRILPQAVVLASFMWVNALTISQAQESWITAQGWAGSNPQRSKEGLDKYGRAYAQPAVTLANCTARYSINYAYIKENYGYAHPEEVGKRQGSYSTRLTTVDSVGFDAALKFGSDCEEICWTTPKRAPLGGGWTFIGNYGFNSSKKCQDTYVKLVSRRGSRIEVDFKTVYRMSKPEYPSSLYSETSQIQCSGWNYWNGSSWAPITSRTRLDSAAKKYC